MNIRKRKYIIEYYRVGIKEGTFFHKFYTCSLFKALLAIMYHSFMNLFSEDKICCRYIGSYVPDL